jgi:hypothetical protein
VKPQTERAGHPRAAAHRRTRCRSAACCSWSAKSTYRACWGFGKEFMAIMRGARLPRMEGRAGAAFCIYWSEVSADCDGPVEWRRPVLSVEAKPSPHSSPSTVIPNGPCVTRPPHRYVGDGGGRSRRSSRKIGVTKRLMPRRHRGGGVLQRFAWHCHAPTRMPGSRCVIVHVVTIRVLNVATANADRCPN